MSGVLFKSVNLSFLSYEAQEIVKQLFNRKIEDYRQLLAVTFLIPDTQYSSN